MRFASLLCILLLAACSKSSTGPKGEDPTVLIRNNGRLQDTLVFTWRDGQGIVGVDTILPSHQLCERFLAQADSAYFEATVNTSHYTQPWFDPTGRSAWTMDVSQATGYGILVGDVSPNLPC